MRWDEIPVHVIVSCVTRTCNVSSVAVGVASEAHVVLCLAVRMGSCGAFGG